MLKTTIKRLKICINIICVVFLIFSLAGCEPLRKKFVRNKKGNKVNELIPILEPYDYESKINVSKERYKNHYMLWRAWVKELDRAVYMGDSDAHIKYYYNEMIGQLNRMGEWLSSQKKSELLDAANEVMLIKDEIHKPKALRSQYVILNTLKMHEKKIRNSFNPKLNLEYEK